MIDSHRPWYLRAFVAVCAWFTALFFAFWFFTSFRQSGGVIAIFGVFLLAVSSMAGRVHRDSAFLGHAALACSLTGRAALAVGLADSFHSRAGVFGVLALAEAAWFSVNPDFSFRMISVCSAFLFLGGLLSVVAPGFQIWLPLMGAGILLPLVFVWLPGRWDGFREEVWRPAGWAAVLVLGLWSLGAGDWSFSGRSMTSLYGASGGLTLLACAFTAWLLHRNTRAATVALPLLLAVGWVMRGNPSVMAGLLMGLVGFRSREDKITAMAGATLLAGTVSYYYQLQDNLLHKSGVLAVSGALFAAAAAWFWIVRKPESSWRGRAVFGQGRARALAALAVLALTSALVDLSAIHAEGLKAGGDQVYLQLRPRDPRDPLMGDYMAVNFQVCNDIASARSQKGDLASVGFAWMRKDEQGVLRFHSLDEGTPRSGLHRVRYEASNNRVSIGTTKVYFQEGTLPRYRNARYGRLKLQPDGALVWLGFADIHLQAL